MKVSILNFDYKEDILFAFLGIVISIKNLIDKNDLYELDNTIIKTCLNDYFNNDENYLEAVPHILSTLVGCDDTEHRLDLSNDLSECIISMCRSIRKNDSDNIKFNIIHSRLVLKHINIPNQFYYKGKGHVSGFSSIRGYYSAVRDLFNVCHVNTLYTSNIKNLEDINIISNNHLIAFNDTLITDIDKKSKYALTKRFHKMNHTCLKCGNSSNLCIHHIYPKSLYPTLQYNIDNTACLCKNCHNEYHRIYGKKYTCNLFSFIDFIENDINKNKIENIIKSVWNIKLSDFNYLCTLEQMLYNSRKSKN